MQRYLQRCLPRWWWLSLLLTVVAWSGSCADRDLLWRYTFADAATSAQVAVMSGQIRAGGCTGEVLFETQFAVDGSGATLPQTLSEGRYGFFIEARRDDCRVIAEGCLVRDLPLDDGDTVSIELSLADRDGCPDGRCDGGRCEVAQCACTNASGQCQPGTTSALCGNDGGMCVACPSGQFCTLEGECSTAPATDVTAGREHSCGIRRGELFCWGNNSTGALGIGAMTGIHPPTRVGSASTWTQVESFSNVTCGVRDDSLFCWGANDVGQLGSGLAGPGAPVPRLVEGSRDMVDSDNTVQFSVGDKHVCYVGVDLRLRCWGDNSNRQLGQMNMASSGTPVEVGNQAVWSTVAAGGGHTCATQRTGTPNLFCWGDNGRGQLGVGGSPAPTPMPTEVNIRVGGSAAGVDFVAAGLAHTCASVNGGRLMCWGSNTSGEGGMSPLQDIPRPVDPMGPALLNSVTGLSLSAASSCAISNTRHVCAGANGMGQLGLGDTSMHTEFDLHRVMEFRTLPWTDLALGGNHGCGIANGVIKCWGSDAFGQVAGSIDSQSGFADVDF